jgi:IS4 transposase
VTQLFISGCCVRQCVSGCDHGTSRESVQQSNILSDQIIRFTSQKAQQNFKPRLRRVVVWDEAPGREIVLLTNHFDFGATTIANMYQDRWEIELFFKALQQNLKIKSFVGTRPGRLREVGLTGTIPALTSRTLDEEGQTGLTYFL